MHVSTGEKVAIVVAVVGSLLGLYAIIFWDPVGQAEEEKAKAAVIAQEEAQKEKQQQAQAMLAQVIEQALLEKGSEVKVHGFDGVLVFDCTGEPLPRQACYALYRSFPASLAEQERLYLRAANIRKVKYRTESGILSGYAWEKTLP